MPSIRREPSAPPHTVHIPVMGLGYTIDTPLKVAHFGISSVVSIIEDELVERMREHQCKLNGEAYVPIPKPSHDHRARRITAYLDMLGRLVQRNMERVRVEPFTVTSDSTKYFELLPGGTPVKDRFQLMRTLPPAAERMAIEDELRKAMRPGSIDVNIMSKIDSANYDSEGNALPPEYCDAMAAFRGFANSTLDSAVVLSAGYNPRLYAYIAEFPDFLPDAQGRLRKRVILKVSDARSALVQGKILAKKGVWVSEFRIESGLNCGGHAFATDGILLGPILEEFRAKRAAIAGELFDLASAALAQAGLPAFPEIPEQRFTVQGGIGTAAEDRFLREHYGMDGTGWGSPFLLVPEVTNVDANTLQQLTEARPSDFYLSWASPLGIPFHNFRPSSSEQQRKTRMAKERPGSPCYKNYLSTNTEFTERPICTASRQYQDLKIKQLKSAGLDDATYAREEAAVMEKDCLCEGLGAAALLKEGLHPAHKLEAVAICPGPNTAYFTQVVSLRTMVDHIYGRVDLLAGVERPHMFAKELSLYMDYLKRELQQVRDTVTAKQQRYFATFKANMEVGIAYYEELLPVLRARAAAQVEQLRDDLDRAARELRGLLLPVVAAVG
ncbi:MAG: hypothetical protein IPM12_11940 [Flavobacteriales bacterium]|nr:hypothetical protein [Flavobacteriales bacterium]